jgi:hypothetical protein
MAWKMLNILCFLLLKINTLFVTVDGVWDFLPITKDDFKKVVIKVKDECEEVAQNLIFKLNWHFLEH